MEDIRRANFYVLTAEQFTDGARSDIIRTKYMGRRLPRAYLE